MRVGVRDIAYHLPGRVVSNNELNMENPDWDLTYAGERIGVESRHIAEEKETALDLAFQACEKLLAANDGLRDMVDGIIFCTQSPDYVMPPNSCILHDMLGLKDEVFAYDYTLACSGYVYGLAMARGLVISGMAQNILLVTADTYSKYIHKQDRSARILFGDGASVSWVTQSEQDKGIVDVKCATSGKDHKTFIVPVGACRIPRSEDTALPAADMNGNIRTPENIRMDGLGVLGFVKTKVPKQVRDILDDNLLNLEDIDLFVFHQSSKLALDSLARSLSIDDSRMYRNLTKIGNTVSSSIPIALKDAMDDGAAKTGDRLLLSGFGVGLSYGCAIVDL